MAQMALWLWYTRYGRGYNPLIRVRGSHSHQSKTQMEGQKGEDTRKKGKMALKKEKKELSSIVQVGAPRAQIS